MVKCDEVIHAWISMVVSSFVEVVPFVSPLGLEEPSVIVGRSDENVGFEARSEAEMRMVQEGLW